jgi:hypothetical protein
MQTANDLAPPRQEQQTRANDSQSPNRAADGKQAAAAAEKTDAPLWDEV